MHGRDLEAVLDQLAHDRIDLGLEQDQVAHHHGAAMGRLERDPAAEREGWADGDPIDRHLQVAARESVAVDVLRYGRRPAQRVIDFLPVDVLCAGAGG